MGWDALLGVARFQFGETYFRRPTLEDLQAAHEGLSPLTAERGGRRELGMR
jgi:hypothetical protein